MIDINTESVLSLADAAKRLPQRRGGKRPHVATLYRWASAGVRGVKLETLQVGGTLCTSLEALQRFCERCSGGAAESTPQTTRSRERQIKQAEAELERAGIA